MSNQLDLSRLTKEQLIALLWELKGTPHTQPIHRELKSRSSGFTIEPDDSNWEEKCRSVLVKALGYDN